jgi:phosphoribosylamine--glycine ligase
MGTYSPLPGVGPAEIEEVLETVHRPVLDELAHRGTPFIGTLFAGLMRTDDGLRVLEFNCRFGDPETQSILPLVDGDLLGALAAAAEGSLGTMDLPVADRAAVTVVVAADGYPEATDAGSPILGVEDAEATGALVFHAGTAARAGALVTNGGRILGVTGVGDDLAEARRSAYEGAELISFSGMRYRRDIALAAAEKSGVRG